MKIKIGISNRHIHLCKETYDILFGSEMKKVSDLNQINEFVTDKKITIIGKKDKIENVKLLGPLRNYDQIEISKKDAIKLGINPPVRKSGDLIDGEKIILKTDKNEIEINACIIAQRHVHINPKDAEKYGYIDNEKVKLIVNNDKGGVMEAFIKISENAFLEAHIDTDDAACFLLNAGDEVELTK